MRVLLKSLDCIHLAPTVFLMSIQNTLTVMVLFGLLDVHGYFSINNLQFWVFMERLTDMDTESINKLFFLFDYDYTGQLNFIEFQLLCCCMVVSKDGLNKDFLQRHTELLVDIMQKSNHAFLNTDEFCRLGSLMGWNLDTLYEVYKGWDRAFDAARHRIWIDDMKFFMVCLIDHGRSTRARNRVSAIKQFRRQWLIELKDLIMDYIVFRVVPPPSSVWIRMSGTDPPLVKWTRRSNKFRTFMKWFWRILILPYWILYKILHFFWDHAKCWRTILISIYTICRCKDTWKTTKIRLKGVRYGFPEQKGATINSAIHYYRNKKYRSDKPIFRYYQKQHEIEGIFERTDPWVDPWFKEQLHMELVEKQLILNRKQHRADDDLYVQDVRGVHQHLLLKYVIGNQSSKYKTVKQQSRKSLLRQPLELRATRRSILSRALTKDVNSKYVRSIFRQFTPEEIDTAEQQVLNKQIHQNLRVAEADDRWERRPVKRLKFCSSEGSCSLQCASLSQTNSLEIQ